MDLTDLTVDEVCKKRRALCASFGRKGGSKVLLKQWIKRDLDIYGNPCV